MTIWKVESNKLKESVQRIELSINRFQFKTFEKPMNYRFNPSSPNQVFEGIMNPTKNPILLICIHNQSLKGNICTMHQQVTCIIEHNWPPIKKKWHIEIIATYHDKFLERGSRTQHFKLEDTCTYHWVKHPGATLSNPWMLTNAA